MNKSKESLNEHAAAVDKILSAPEETLGSSVKETADNIARLDTLLKNTIEGTRHCSGSPDVQNLLKNLDYAKCFLTGAEYFQGHLARSKAIGDPEATLKELHECNKEQVARATKRLNECRPLWKKIKAKEFSIEDERGR